MPRIPVTLTLQDLDDLERILEALETEACHNEMNGHYASADICRMLAQDLALQNPLSPSPPPLTRYHIELEDGTHLQAIEAESPEDAYNQYVAEHFGNGSCGWDINVVDAESDDVVGAF
ncbi:hypothetical protein U2F10_02720 [Leptothoe sp. EHU-05/26/07-4]